MEVVKVSMPEVGIMQISLNRPEQLNALNKDLLQNLSQVFDQAKQDKAVKAILLTGEGKGFCAGADIKQLLPLKGKDGLEFARYGQAVFRKLELLGKPSIAAVHGFAFGGGCELAMAATMRVVASNAVFGQPEIKLGVIPGFGGTQRLARLIGKGRALEICLTGRRFTAEEAFHWGFIKEMAPAEELLVCASAALRELIQLPPIAIQNIIAAIDQGFNLPIDEALEVEANLFALCCDTNDKREGVEAFLEKRHPRFHGE